MPAVTFGNCPVRDDGHIGARLRRAPTPHPMVAPRVADTDSGYEGDTDSLESLDSSPLPALTRASSPYAEMSPYTSADDYAVDFVDDVVVETRQRRVQFFDPPRGSFSRPRCHAGLERCPTPEPDASNYWLPTDAWGRVPDPDAVHGLRKCARCVRKCLHKALVCCGLKRSP
ncbi:hypothetical protein MBLNU457_6016t1 [Dothideomycetes sp. NU457]